MHRETPHRISDTPTNDGNRQQRHGARGATMRRDRSTRPTQRNGWGHAQDIARERQQSPLQKRTRPPPRRSEGWNEWATPTGPPTEEQTREKWQTPEGEGPSREGRTLADLQPQGGSQQAHQQPQVTKRNIRQRPKPHPKEKAPSPKNNLLTGGRAEQVDLEADLRPGEHKGENQEPPKTCSFRKDHPVRGHQRLQGASRGTKPQPVESRAGYPRQTPDPQQGPRRQHWTPTRNSEEHWRELRTTLAHGHITRRTTWQHTPKDRACRDAADSGVRANHEPTREPDPNGDTKPSFRSRTTNLDPAGVTPSRR